MASTTKRERESRLAELEEQLADAAARDDGGVIDVEYREAAPTERPEGVAYDPEERTLFYDFWETQRDCLDHLGGDDQDIVAFLGGYRSGKSVTGARWVLSKALEYPGSRWLAMGQDYTKATDTTYRVLFENLPGERTHIVTSSFSGPEQSPLVVDYNRKEHRLTLFNDSVIVLGSADKWSRYAGDEYAGIWLDEPSHYGDELHDLMEMMGTRLTAPRGPKVMFWTLTGNGYNAAWRVLEKREDGDGNPIGSRIALERASVLENPYIADEDKERLKRQFEGGGREEQALHGGFDVAQGLVYSNFSRDAHVIPTDEGLDAVEGDWRIYGYDAGWNDPRVLLEIGKTPYDQLVVLDEFHRSAAHVEDAIQWVEQTDKPDGTIFAEHEPSEIEKFRRAGFRVEKAEKSLDAGIAEVRRRLEADGNMTVKKGGTVSGVVDLSDNSPEMRESGPEGEENESKEEIEDAGSADEKRPRVGLLVTERCENLIREFLGYKEEQVGTAGATDHCLDGLRYAVMGGASQESQSITKSKHSLGSVSSRGRDTGSSREFKDSELGEAVLGALDQRRNGPFG